MVVIAATSAWMFARNASSLAGRALFGYKKQPNNIGKPHHDESSGAKSSRKDRQFKRIDDI